MASPYERKCFIIGCLALVIMGLLVWDMFYQTQQATKDNTYQINTKVDYVDVMKRRREVSDYIALHINGDKYFCERIGRNRKTDEIVEQLLVPDREYTITVWEHYSFLRIFYTMRTRSNLFWEKQIVEVRSGEEVIIPLDYFNNDQKTDRILVIVFVVVIYPFVLFLIYFACFRWLREYIQRWVKKRKKQLKKEKRKNEQRNT